MSPGATLLGDDVFLIVFGQQWRSKLHQALMISKSHTRTLLNRSPTVSVNVHLVSVSFWVENMSENVSDSSEEQILWKVLTGTNDKGMDNCFPAQGCFWWMSHYNLEMMDVRWIKPGVYLWLFRQNEAFEGLSIPFFAQRGGTVQSERF